MIVLANLSIYGVILNHKSRHSEVVLLTNGADRYSFIFYSHTSPTLMNFTHLGDDNPMIAIEH